MCSAGIALSTSFGYIAFLLGSRIAERIILMSTFEGSVGSCYYVSSLH